MADKQIIIDGVDVSGCTHKKNDACMAITSFCGDFKHYCDDLNDCYYKQLKRKEQECEELKGISMKKCPKCGEVYLNSVGMEAFNQLDQLKAQLLDQEAETLKAGEIIHNLKQTLTEIKEIAGKIANYYDGDEYELMRKDAEQILQKISECEVE